MVRTVASNSLNRIGRSNRYRMTINLNSFPTFVIDFTAGQTRGSVLSSLRSCWVLRFAGIRDT